MKVEKLLSVGLTKSVLKNFKPLLLSLVPNSNTLIWNNFEELKTKRSVL